MLRVSLGGSCGGEGVLSDSAGVILNGRYGVARLHVETSLKRELSPSDIVGWAMIASRKTV